MPWTDVRFEGFKRMLFLEFACFRLGAGGPVLAVYRRTGERLHPFLGRDGQAGFLTGQAFGEPLIDRRIIYVAAAAGVAALVVVVLLALPHTRDFFLQRAALEPSRVRVIDASGDVAAVAARVLAAVQTLESR